MAAEVAAVERLLGETRRRLAEVQEVARVGSWEWIVATDDVRWSDELFRIFGVKPDDFTGTFDGFLACLHSEDRAVARANVERALRTGEPYQGDYRLAVPTDEERWVHCRGKALVAEDGTVERVIGTTQDITDRRRVEAELMHRALHDPLTGLPNRALLWDRVAHALLRTQRTTRPVVVFFVDVDGLKAINDGAGHAIGDQVLRLVARRLTHATRANDTVARYGGDEFVVVAEDVRLPDDAADLGGRLLAACTFAVPHHSGALPVSASVGGVVAGADAAPEEVVRDADAAMYRAKARGGATIELA